MVLPRYQKTGIQVRQPSGMDFADAREEARLGRTISAELDRMGEFAFREGEKLAIRRGEERVREEGAVPVLTALQEQKGPRTIAEQAAFDAANRIAVVEIETDARSEMRKLVAEADEANMDLSVFNEKMSDIQDGYTASLQVVDPVAAGVLNARITEDNATYSTKYSEIVTVKAKNAYAENTTEILLDGAQKIKDLALTEGATVESIQKAGEDLLQTALLRGTGDKKAQKLTDTAVNQAIRENLAFRYENADGIAAKRAIVNDLLEIEQYPGLGYEQTLNLKDAYQNQLNREITNGRNNFIEELNDAILFQTITGKQKEGFEFNEDKLTELFLEEDGDTGILDTLMMQWENTQEDIKNYGSLSSMSGAAEARVLRELQGDLDDIDPDASGTEVELLQKRVNNFRQAIIDKHKKLTEDPVSYIIDTNDQAARIFKDLNIDIRMGDFGDMAFQIERLEDILLDQYQKLGIPSEQRVLPKSTAKQIISAVQSFSDEATVPILQDIQTIFLDKERQGLIINDPELYSRFIADLSNNGLAPEIVEAMHTNDIGLQKTLVELSRLPLDQIKPKDTTVGKNAFNLLAEQTKDYQEAFTAGGGDEAVRVFNEQFDVAEKLLYKYINDGLQYEQAVKKVKDDIFPEINGNNIIDDGINQNFIVPMNFDGSLMDTMSSSLLDPRRLREMDIKELDVGDAPGFVSEAISFASLASNGMWLNNSTKDGIVLHYRTDRGHLIPAKYNNGEIVDIKFKDLPNVFTTVTQKAVPPSERNFESYMPGGTSSDVTGEGLITDPAFSEVLGGGGGTLDENANEFKTLTRKALTSIPKGASGTNRNKYQEYVLQELNDFKLTEGQASRSINLLSFNQWLETQGN